MGRNVGGIAIGMAIGLGVSAMIIPCVDKRTQRNLKRARKKVMNKAEDSYDKIVNILN